MNILEFPKHSDVGRKHLIPVLLDFKAGLNGQELRRKWKISHAFYSARLLYHDGGP